VEEIAIDVVAMSSVAYIIYETLVDTVLFKINQQFSIIKDGTRYTFGYGKIKKYYRIAGIAVAVVWIVIAVLVINAVF